MGQSLNRQVAPSLLCKRLLPRHKTPRLAAMLFQQRDAVDGHAPVHGFAHVVDGQQSDLHSGECLHLNAGLANGFGGGGANHT